MWDFFNRKGTISCVLLILFSIQFVLLCACNITSRDGEVTHLLPLLHYITSFSLVVNMTVSGETGQRLYKIKPLDFLLPLRFDS